jgi:hypothetical protein
VQYVLNEEFYLFNDSFRRYCQITSKEHLLRLTDLSRGKEYKVWQYVPFGTGYEILKDRTKVRKITYGVRVQERCSRRFSPRTGWHKRGVDSFFADLDTFGWGVSTNVRPMFHIYHFIYSDAERAVAREIARAAAKKLAEDVDRFGRSFTDI